MARVHHVKKARKGIPGTGIKKGDSYYWWKFRFGARQVSKTQPKASQLTQSPFLAAVEAIRERIGDLIAEDIESGSISDIVSELEQLKDEAETSLDNMPEQLREGSSSGEMLQERIDGLTEWISNLEAIDVDIDEESLRQEVIEELGEAPDNLTEAEKEEGIEEALEEKKQGRYEEILEEVQNSDPGCF